MNILLEGSKFIWSDEELKSFRNFWSYGLSIEDIAKRMQCEPLEVILLILDQAERKKIEPRQNGIF